jgi:hypothetical protein
MAAMKKLRWLVVGILLMFVVSAVQPSFADPPLPTPVGRVVWIKGTFKAMMENAEERILQKQSVIYVHDTLMTDGDSQAQIVFTDNTLMTFRQSTKFFINQYAYDAKAKTKSVGKYIMNLIEGGFRTITGIIAKNNPADYQVNTPVATIGVRGTDYAVYIKGGELYVGQYDGKPCVKSEKSGAAPLCLDASSPYGYVPGANAAPVPLAQRPIYFEQKLEIVPTKITPFSGGGGSQTTPTTTPSGPITNFCITL